MARRILIRRLAPFFAAVLLLASIGYLIGHFEWRAAILLLRDVDLTRFVGLILFAHLAYLAIRAWRWQIVLRHANSTITFKDLYWITSVTVSLAILTPGQLGEAFKIELLNRRGLLPRLPGLGGFAIERVLDLLAIASMGAIGLLLGSGLGDRYPGLISVIAGVIGACALVLLLLTRIDSQAPLAGWARGLLSGVGDTGVWIRMSGLTLIAWALIAIGWQVALETVGIVLSVPQVLWLIAVVTLSTLASMVPGGLGVAEVVTATALIGMGIEPGAAYAGAIMLRLYALVIVVIGLLHLMGGKMMRARSTVN